MVKPPIVVLASSLGTPASQEKHSLVNPRNERLDCPIRSAPLTTGVEVRSLVLFEERSRSTRGLLLQQPLLVNPAANIIPCQRLLKRVYYYKLSGAKCSSVGGVDDHHFDEMRHYSNFKAVAIAGLRRM